MRNKGMTNDTKLLMAKIRRKMTHWNGLSLTACGHELPVKMAYRARFELEKLIEDELVERDNLNLDRGPG